jgi:signal peptidase
MKKENTIIKTIIDFFSYLLLSVLIFLSAFFAFYIVENAYAKATNTKPLISLFVIVSPSMVPTINVNDMIVDIGVNEDSDLEENDIITFTSNVINTGGYTITHRINKINIYEDEFRYVTKGDNNKSVDVGFTTIDRIVGKVLLIIPDIGAIQELISSKWGWLLIVIVPSLAILIADIVNLINLIRIKKEIIEIKPIGNIDHKNEIESNKNMRVLLEKSKELDKLSEEENEEGTNIK